MKYFLLFGLLIQEWYLTTRQIKKKLSAGLQNYDHWEIAHRDCEKTESQIVSEKNPRKIVSSDHLFPVTGNSVFWNYKPKQNYKSKMLKKFSELLENAFETMKEGINIWSKDDFGPISFHGSLLRMVQISKKYTTLETEVKDQLKYCLTVAERDEKVEGSCLRTIFNSDFFWNWIKRWFVVCHLRSHLKICFWFFQNLFSPTTAGVLFINTDSLPIDTNLIVDVRVHTVWSIPHS